MPQFEACSLECIPDPFVDGLFFYLFAARNDPGCHACCFLLAFHIVGEYPQIFDPSIGTTADKNIVDRFAR